jgi:hypothetical protein
MISLTGQLYPCAGVQDGSVVCPVQFASSHTFAKEGSAGFRGSPCFSHSAVHHWRISSSMSGKWPGGPPLPPNDTHLPGWSGSSGAGTPGTASVQPDSTWEEWTWGPGRFRVEVLAELDDLPRDPPGELHIRRNEP